MLDFICILLPFVSVGYISFVFQLHFLKSNFATFKCHPILAGLCVPPFVLGNLLI